MVFWAEFSSVLPERYIPSHTAYALSVYMLGCRGEDPAQFDYNEQNPTEVRVVFLRSGNGGGAEQGLY